MPVRTRCVFGGGGVSWLSRAFGGWVVLWLSSACPAGVFVLWCSGPWDGGWAALRRGRCGDGVVGSQPAERWRSAASCPVEPRASAPMHKSRRVVGTGDPAPAPAPSRSVRLGRGDAPWHYVPVTSGGGVGGTSGADSFVGKLRVEGRWVIFSAGNQKTLACAIRFLQQCAGCGTASWWRPHCCTRRCIF